MRVAGRSKSTLAARNTCSVDWQRSRTRIKTNRTAEALGMVVCVWAVLREKDGIMKEKEGKPLSDTVWARERECG